MADVRGSRPRVRGDCAGVPRPCPFTSCRYHLASEPRGAARAEIAETCALDLAERGGMTLDEVGEVLGVSRARVQQIEAEAKKRLRAVARIQELAALLTNRSGVNGTTDSTKPRG